MQDKNQKYKEGKFVLERWSFYSSLYLSNFESKLKSDICVYLCDRCRIIDEVTEEFNLDARPSSSDTENP